MKIICFEGPTASGKTTALREIEKRLKQRSVSVETLDERNAVRDLISRLQINNAVRSTLPPMTESLFWTMNQVYRYETEIAKKQGKVLLLDRYLLTPIVYQFLAMKGLGVKLEDVARYITQPFGLHLPAPDVSFLLLAPMDSIKKRFKAREHREMTEEEISITQEATDLYRRAGTLFKPCYIIDTGRSLTEVCDTIESHLHIEGGQP